MAADAPEARPQPHGEEEEKAQEIEKEGGQEGVCAGGDE